MDPFKIASQEPICLEQTSATKLPLELLYMVLEAVADSTEQHKILNLRLVNRKYSSA